MGAKNAWTKSLSLSREIPVVTNRLVFKFRDSGRLLYVVGSALESRLPGLDLDGVYCDLLECS